MTAIASLANSPRIEAALRRASQATGTDFDYLLTTAIRESNLKTDAKAKTSSATGLFQFIEQTWLATVRKAGQVFNLPRVSNAIKQTDSGRHIVPDPQLRQEILALRKDPEVAALIAGVYTSESSQALSGRLGRAPSSGELYIAHFLGANGGGKLIEAAERTPDARADQLFPAAAKANRPIFFDHDGTPRGAREVYQNLIARHGDVPVITAAASNSEVRIAPATSQISRTGFQRAAPAEPAQPVSGQRPLLQSLFIASFEGDRLLDQATRAGPALSPGVIDTLAAASGHGAGKRPSAADVRRAGPDIPARVGLLAGARAQTGAGPLTHTLFRVG